jgi:hypothetical protein
MEASPSYNLCASKHRDGTASSPPMRMNWAGWAVGTRSKGRDAHEPEQPLAAPIATLLRLQGLRASFQGGRAEALLRGSAGPATPSGRLFLSPSGRLIVWRHRFFQAFKPWERRARARSTLGLTHAAEHKSCGILKSHPAAHNLTLSGTRIILANVRHDLSEVSSQFDVPASEGATSSVERKTNDTIAQGNNRSGTGLDRRGTLIRCAHRRCAA